LHREEQSGSPRNALRMAPLRSLLVLLILIGLVSAATAVAQAPVEWYTDTGGGGGALAGPPPHNSGGGAFAPTGTGPADVNLPPPQDVRSSDSPPAQAATASQPALPHSSGPASPQAQPAGTPATAAAQADPADSDTATIGSLPFTGLELVAIVAAGLCLVVAGAALRPRPARR
jgi:hypothetical protein